MCQGDSDHSTKIPLSKNKSSAGFESVHINQNLFDYKFSLSPQFEDVYKNFFDIFPLVSFNETFDIISVSSVSSCVCIVYLELRWSQAQQ